METINILYLYTELMGYQIPVFKELVKKSGAKLHVVHWDLKKLTPYNPPNLENVSYYKRSHFSKRKLVELGNRVMPDLVYISGWMDKGYLQLARHLMKKGIPVIAGSDTQWKGIFRQRMATIIFPFIRKKLFSHIWIAGPYQFEYARKLAFKKQEIIFNCLSGDVSLFNSAFKTSEKPKRQRYPHQFLYVGRFENSKGIDLLIQAWENLKAERKDWKLSFIGNGPQKSQLTEKSEIILKEFMQPDRLLIEIENSGCFILPSRKEPWGMVLHEFSAAGLPIICSDVCGASPVFVIPNYNGYIFKSNVVKSLENQMLKIINTSDQELIIMSQNSHTLGQRITPEIVAASLLSVL